MEGQLGGVNFLVAGFCRGRLHRCGGREIHRQRTEKDEAQGLGEAAGLARPKPEGEGEGPSRAGAGGVQVAESGRDKRLTHEPSC